MSNKWLFFVKLYAKMIPYQCPGYEPPNFICYEGNRAIIFLKRQVKNRFRRQFQAKVKLTHTKGYPFITKMYVCPKGSVFKSGF